MLRRPLGGTLGAAQINAARVITRDERAAALGRTLVTAVAFAPDGTPAGYTDLEHHSGEAEGELHQEDTLVVGGHRGQRLAAALKVAATSHIHRLKPRVRWVDTWNATSNTAMVRTNELLGHRPTEHDQEWLKSW